MLLLANIFKVSPVGGGLRVGGPRDSGAVRAMLCGDPLHVTGLCSGPSALIASHRGAAPPQCSCEVCVELNMVKG